MVILQRKSRLLILGSALLLVAACNQSKPAPAAEQSNSSIAAIAELGNLATDPYAQMSFAFDGNPPKELIQEKVDKVMAMYSIEATNPNRSHVGNMLVALRKEHGHSEIEILDKLIEMPANGEFEQAAAAIAESIGP